MICSTNAIGEKHDQVEWQNAGLRIFIAHQKLVSFGSTASDPRHVYTNSLEPGLVQYWPLECSGLQLAMMTF